MDWERKAADCPLYQAIFEDNTVETGTSVNYEIANDTLLNTVPAFHINRQSVIRMIGLDSILTFGANH